MPEQQSLKFSTSMTGFVLHFVKEFWGRFAFILFVSIFTALTATIFPYFIKRIVNILENYHEAPEHVYHAIGGVFLLLIIFWILNELLLEARGVVKIYTYPKFRARIREEVFGYVKSHSHEYLHNQLAGTMAQKISKLPESVQEVTKMFTANFVTAGITMLIVFTMLWSIDPIFSGIVFIWLIIHTSISTLFFRYGAPTWETHAHSVAVLTGRMVDVFNNIFVIRMFARDLYEMEYLNKFQRDEIKKSQKAMWVSEFAKMGLGLAGLLMLLTMIFTLVYGWTKGWVSFGDFTQVSMQAFILLGSAWAITEKLGDFAKETGSITDALSIIRKSHDVVDKKNAGFLMVSQAKIEFSQVAFSYHPRQPLFEDLNLVIPAGQKVGLIGRSGSGKSTIANLILRFYDIKSGKVCIDGQNIAEVVQDSLRSYISMIPQEPFLFHRSIMENIRYGRLEATDEEVIAAAKHAHCHEFIENLEKGYDAVIGENGVKLSGGQKQRLAIARAILKNAPILILDEATSALDTETENLIHDSLHYLMKGKTVLAIAHRLATLKDMDRIIVFDKGKILEDGKRLELIKADGHFAHLWKMQTNGFIADD